MDAAKKNRLLQTKNAINKRFGENTVLTAREAHESGRLTKKRIKTPSLEFNDMLHGGIAGIVELFGPNSSGKTSLAIETIAKAQRENPDFVAAWLETEGSVTEDILNAHGVDLDRLIFWRQDDVGSAENALDIARAWIGAGDVDMMVFNSVAGLTPRTEVEDDLQKQNVALIARLMSKFLRVATNAASKNDIVLVFINQVRDNIGVMYGETTTTTGGKALGFYASQRIRMNRVKVQKGDPIPEEDGVKISCITYKNRFSGPHNPFTKCHYYATYAHGIDSIVALPQLLLKAGVVRNAGAWWYYDDAQGEPVVFKGTQCKWKSLGAFIDSLRSDDDLREMLTSKLESAAENQTITEREAVKAIEEEIQEEGKAMERLNEGEELAEALNTEP